MAREDHKLDIKRLLSEQLVVLDAATAVLAKSYERAVAILAKKPGEITELDAESLEAFTARFGRLSDYLVQRVFRTIDQLELSDEGSVIDRMNRMEKRRVIDSSEVWQDLRRLRNSIAHEYLIESSDQVVADAKRDAPRLLSCTEAIKKYCAEKGYT